MPRVPGGVGFPSAPGEMQGMERKPRVIIERKGLEVGHHQGLLLPGSISQGHPVRKERGTQQRCKPVNYHRWRLREKGGGR